MPHPFRLICAGCNEEALHSFQCGHWLSVCCSQIWVAPENKFSALSEVSDSSKRSRGGRNCSIHFRRRVLGRAT
jgi:hypothetical protein